MITASDRRHGTRAGYLAGCRTSCCTEPNFRYQKRSKIRLQREGTQIVPAGPVVDRLQWWIDRGVSPSAVTKAAGVGDGTLRDLLAGHHDLCLKSTRAAVLAVDWDALPDRGLCFADLTRARVHSMMAAGHPLEWICGEAGRGLPMRGRWRNQARVTVATARIVRDIYDRAPLEGPSKITATKARNAGHLHPLAWEDPGVLSMPAGWAPAASAATVRTHAGRPVVVPDLVEDFDFLISLGETEETAAARVGVKNLASFKDQRRRFLAQQVVA